VDEDQGLTAVQSAKRGIGMRGMTLLTNFSFAKKFMKEGGGGIRVRICTPDISSGVPGEKCRSRHVQVCYGIPRRQILHCEDRYVSLT
jgi:hypothetical protein